MKTVIGLALALALLAGPAAAAWADGGGPWALRQNRFDRQWNSWGRRDHGLHRGGFRGPGVVVAPPPVFVAPAPRAFWVPGGWAWSGFGWVWMPGHWAR
jgi:hypothetical protein